MRQKKPCFCTAANICLLLLQHALSSLPCAKPPLSYLVGILDDLHVIYSKLVCIKFHQPLRYLRQAS